MDLILISEEKLKIILTESDMRRFNIDVESLDYSNVTTKKVFWEILDEAKTKSGFNPDKSKLYVQVFPSQDGGCEMFITKFSCALSPSNTLHRKKTYKLSQSCKDQEENGIFLTLGFQELCQLCRRMSKEKLHLSTSLYYDMSGVYIFIISDSKKMPSYISSKNNKVTKIPEYFSEYAAVKELNNRVISYAEEHCQKIAEGNAVEMLAKI